MSPLALKTCYLDVTLAVEIIQQGIRIGASLLYKINIMIIGTSGYDALIEYLVESFSLFEGGAVVSDGETLEDFVTDKVATMVMTICEQKTQLEAEQRFALLAEADKIVEELAEVLASRWQKPLCEKQREFLGEFIDLLKNLFDSEVGA
ncbi:hypothetical protein VST7929_01551 [Vibrio stylophorae]|uniref:DUF3802 family protein n=1 Tax=Vibrio stylophorae TaxID=659351 RepID=A0ABM8ZU36_9VIBR|nr:DUF3802 family protein [Vibrio stylophorae]CAH0533680.1 hypothetical protein VST7929_01551 [Vibrio stylophorae]